MTESRKSSGIHKGGPSRTEAEATALLSDLVDKLGDAPVNSTWEGYADLRESLSRARSFLKDRKAPLREELDTETRRAREAAQALRDVRETLVWALDEHVGAEDPIRPYVLFWAGQLRHTLSRVDPSFEENGEHTSALSPPHPAGLSDNEAKHVGAPTTPNPEELTQSDE